MKRLIFTAAFLAVLFVSGPVVFAGDPSTLSNALSFSGMAAVPEDELASQSGRQGIDLLQMNDSEQMAQLENNEIQGVSINGGNIIEGGSFAGAAGFATSIQNSGNNVIIQDSTLVNVTFSQ